MIPQSKEKLVLEMLAKDKYSLRKISKVTGISWGTVKKLRDNTQLRKRTNPPMLMRRKAELHRCPKCLTLVTISPCIKCNPDYFQKHIEIRPDIYADMATTNEAKKQLANLLCLANDLQEFAMMFPSFIRKSSNSPLIASLVDRARDIYQEILKPGNKDEEKI